MLVALAVSSIIIIATYASYEMVATQYKKNMDVADMHTSGRAIMRIIERDIRMAGFEYRDKDAKVTYGTISSPLTIKDSGNKCCDEVTVIYDYFDEESKKAERIRIRYWAGPHTSNKGFRHRLYKQKDILGRNKKILANPKLGTKDVMADYIEDFQISNIVSTSDLYVDISGYRIDIYSTTERKNIDSFRKTHSNTGHLAFGPDGLLYASWGTRINIYNTVTKQQVGQINLNWNSRYFVFGPDGNLYVHNDDLRNEINIYNPSTKNKVGQMPLNNRVKYRKAFAFGPDGFLYVKTYSKQIDIYDITSKKQVDKMNVHERNLELTFGPDGLLYANNNTIFIYNTTTKKLVDQFTPNWFVKHIEFGSDGLLYAINTSNGSDVRIYNVTTKQLLGSIHLRQDTKHIALKNKRTGQESLVTINLTLRTKNQYGKDRQYKKKDYHGGNYKLDKTDKYKRDTFSSTVLVRNLAL
jgi:hypothetical protein